METQLCVCACVTSMIQLRSGKIQSLKTTIPHIRTYQGALTRERLIKLGFWMEN